MLPSPNPSAQPNLKTSPGRFTVRRRLLIGLIVVVFSLVSGGLLSIAWLLSEDRYVRILERELETAFVADVEIASSRLSFRHGLGIQFENVVIQPRDTATVLLSAQRIDLLLDTGALLRGRLLFRHVYCLQPHIRVAASNHNAHAEQSGPTRLGTSRGNPAVGILRLFSGSTRLADRIGASSETESDNGGWLSPRLVVRHLVVDDAEVIFTQTNDARPMVLSNAGLRISVDAQRGATGRLVAELGLQGKLGQIILESRVEDWQAPHKASTDEASTDQSSKPTWQGEIQLRNITIHQIGEWFGADWPQAVVDFSGSYTAHEAARTRVSGVLSVRTGRLPRLQVSSGRIAISDLTWTNPRHASEWFLFSPLAGLFTRSAVSLTSLVAEGRVEELSARLSETGVDLRISAGRLRVEDGTLQASQLAGRYGRSSTLTDLRADWRPRISEPDQPSMLRFELAATLELADDLASLLKLIPFSGENAFVSRLSAPSGQASVELRADIPLDGPTIGNDDSTNQWTYEGGIRWRAAGFRVSDLGLDVSDLNGFLRVTPQTVSLENVEFDVGESRGVLNGEVHNPLSAHRAGRLGLSIPRASVRDVAGVVPDLGVRPLGGTLNGELYARFGPEKDTFRTAGRLNLRHARIEILPFVKPLEVGAGQISWGSEGGRIEVRDGRLPGGRLNGSAELQTLDPLDMSAVLRCEEMDLGPTLQLDSASPDPKTRVEPDLDKRIRIEIICDRVRYESFTASDVRIVTQRHDRQVDFNLAEADVSGGRFTGTATLWLDSDALSVKPRVSRVDAAPFFAALGHPTDLISGTLDATGELEIAHWKSWDKPEDWEGTLSVSVQDGVAKQMPILVRLWTALSLQSILSFVLPEIPNEGLKFSLLGGDLSLARGSLTTDNLSLIGHAVRLDTQGEVQLRSKSVDLTAQVVPLRGITSVVEKVPIAGKLLAKGTDQLTALPFEIKGPYAEPQVRLRLLKKVIP